MIYIQFIKINKMPEEVNSSGITLHRYFSNDYNLLTQIAY